MRDCVWPDDMIWLTGKIQPISRSFMSAGKFIQEKSWEYDLSGNVIGLQVSIELAPEPALKIDPKQAPDRM